MAVNILREYINGLDLHRYKLCRMTLRLNFTDWQNFRTCAQSISAYDVGAET